MKPQKANFKQTEIGMIPDEWEEKNEDKINKRNKKPRDLFRF